MLSLIFPCRRRNGRKSQSRQPNLVLMQIFHANARASFSPAGPSVPQPGSIRSHSRSFFVGCGSTVSESMGRSEAGRRVASSHEFNKYSEEDNEGYVVKCLNASHTSTTRVCHSSRHRGCQLTNEQGRMCKACRFWCHQFHHDRYH